RHGRRHGRWPGRRRLGRHRARGRRAGRRPAADRDRCNGHLAAHGAAPGRTVRPGDRADDRLRREHRLPVAARRPPPERPLRGHHRHHHRLTKKERERKGERSPLMTTVKIHPVSEPTALYCRYEGNYEPQPVYVALDLANGALHADYRGTHNTPTWVWVWLGQVRTWSIPPLVADEANALLREIATLAQRILDGSSIEVNPRTGDPVGVLNDDAMAAEWEIYEIIENWREDPTVSVVEEISA